MIKGVYFLGVDPLICLHNNYKNMTKSYMLFIIII